LATLPLVVLALGPESLDLVAEPVALALDGLHATLQARVVVDHGADRSEIVLHGLHGPAHALQDVRGGVGVEGDDRGDRKHAGCGDYGQDRRAVHVAFPSLVCVTAHRAWAAASHACWGRSRSMTSLTNWESRSAIS